MTLARSQSTQSLLKLHAELKNKIVIIKRRISQYKHAFVDDETMARMLHAMLLDIKHLKLIDFTSLDNVNQQVKSEEIPKIASSAYDVGNLEPSNYRLIVQGDYFAVRRYLSRLESLPWQLYWQRIEYNVKTYPISEAIIEFYTLDKKQHVIKEKRMNQ